MKPDEPDLDDLYQEILLDHNKNPRNFGDLPEANRSARGYYPLCGDQVELFLDVEGDRIEKISFKGSGCAIRRPRRVLTALLGKDVAEAGNYSASSTRCSRPPALAIPPIWANRGLRGVREFPCASVRRRLLRFRRPGVVAAVASMSLCANC